MSWVIYKHTNIFNGKTYIGQTKQTAERRWRNGIGYTKDNQDNHFSRAIKLYGWDSFLHEIIEKDILSQDDANKRETFWIKFYDSVEKGYNSNYGGDSREWTQEMRQKASISHKGKKISEEHLLNLKNAVLLSAKDPIRNKKISDALKGRKFSSTHKEKLSLIAQKRVGTNNPFFGKHHSESQKEKYRKIFGKEVICLETGVLFSSSEEAAQRLGINGANIRSACRHGIQAKIGNLWFHFYYKNEELPEFKYNKVKRVINLETNDIYDNLIEAGSSIKKTSKLIGMCCRNKGNTAGGFHWMFYDDYLKCTFEEIQSIKNKNLLGKGRRKPVICIETDVLYDSTCQASKQTGICQTSIAKVCSGMQVTAGGYHWKYYNEHSNINE